jgi:subtilisin family serine protease
MRSLELVNLKELMNRTSGIREIVVGLIDGPVATDHPDLAAESLREISDAAPGTCSIAHSAACTHGTFVAGILSSRRGSNAPAICPGCTLLLRPIFEETAEVTGQMPSTTPERLAGALIECVKAGARVINMSLALARTSQRSLRELDDALGLAARRGAIVVAAAGNQGVIAGSAITRHAAVIPVAACDLRGTPTSESNLGNSIGRRGLRAPGTGITSLGTAGQSAAFSGTSVAAPFVTGAIALLWSEFPTASAAEVKFAITMAAVSNRPRSAVVPPLLNAWAAYQVIAAGAKSANRRGRAQ